MKHFKTLLFAGLLFVGATSFSIAQSKVAHINTQELVASMPEMLSARAELEKLQKSYETEIQTLASELQKKMESEKFKFFCLVIFKKGAAADLACASAKRWWSKWVE